MSDRIEIEVSGVAEIGGGHVAEFRGDRVEIEAGDEIRSDGPICIEVVGVVEAARD
jgi:hypothetical protein